MTREELDRDLKAIDSEKKSLEDKKLTLIKKKIELQQQYVKEYPNLIKIGSKIRIKSKYRIWSGEQIHECVVFVGSHKYIEGYDYHYSFIHEDDRIGTKLFKIKKNGQASERVERIMGDIIEIEILEQ